MKSFFIAAFLVLFGFSAAAEEPFIYRALSGTSMGYTSTDNTMDSYIGPFVTVVRLVCTSHCFVAIDSTPDATAATGTFIPALVPEYFSVFAGERVAAIRATADGTIYIQEMGR